MSPRDAAANAPPCTICGAPTEPRYAPFCSKRCADVDLHRWLSGTYAIPAVEGADDPDENSGEGDA